MTFQTLLTDTEVISIMLRSNTVCPQPVPIPDVSTSDAIKSMSINYN